MDQLQSIKEYGLSLNKKTREAIKNQAAVMEYNQALKSIGIEIISHPIKINNTKTMKIESYYNYSRSVQHE
jgi:hypothetical protein